MPAYELFSDTEVLGRMAMERMLARLSTLRYRVGLDPVGARTEQADTATSKSAVSRRFVAATETALAELRVADLSSLDLVALMVDGVHFGERCCVVALDIDIDGVNHPASLGGGLHQERHPSYRAAGRVRERGLDVSRPILTVLDGSKALRPAVLDVFNHPVIARCQLHKLKNVQDRLPQKLRSVVAKADARGLSRPDRWAPKPSWRSLPVSWSAPTPAWLHPGRNDGAALVLRGDGRSQQAVPPVNGHLHLPHCEPLSNGMSRPKCQNQRAQLHQQHSLMRIGPPPKIYEVRDILPISPTPNRGRSPNSAKPTTSPT